MDKIDLPDPMYAKTYRLLPALAKLRDALAPLPIRHRIAFALCCCERLYPSYQTLASFLHIADGLRPVIDRVWKHVLGRGLAEPEIKQLMEKCASLPLGEEGCCQHYHGAVDAVGAVYMAVRSCFEFCLDNVVRVASLTRDKVAIPLWNAMAQEIAGGVGRDENEHIQEAIACHPDMLAEMEKEAAQLRFLLDCEELSETKVSQLLSL